MTGTSAEVQAACRRSIYRPHRVAGRKAEYSRFSVLPSPVIYRNLRIKVSVILESAMGSATFLNEATNQLAELYMKYAMKIPGAPALSQQEYWDELQKVKMYIADRNLYGVDLNPTAVELAEVSIWLNTLSADKYVPNFPVLRK